MPQNAKASEIARLPIEYLPDARINPSSAAIMAGPHTAPGLSESPGGRMIIFPSGPTYPRMPTSLFTITVENSRGIQRAGSHTWRMPTIEFTPLQTRITITIRLTWRRSVINAGAQMSGINTDAYN